MNGTDFFIPEYLGNALGWMVLHVLWQATLIATLAGIALVLMRRRSARSRYRMANAALVAILIAALSTFLYYYDSPSSNPAGVQTAAPHTAASPVQADSVQMLPAGSIPGSAALTDRFNRYLPLVVTIWFLGMSLFFLRLLGNFGYVCYLKTRQNFPAEQYWQDLLERLVQKSGLNKTIGLVESAVAGTPMVVGFFKPVILFPVGMINRLDPQEAEAILAHELAHILRNDYLFNMLQCAVEALFYFHPAVWWLSNTIRHEREMAADDTAVRLTGNPLAYAKALVVVQDTVFTPASLAPAFAGAGKNRLLKRVQHILNIQHSKNSAMEKIIVTCGILLTIIGIGYTQTKTTTTVTSPQTHSASTDNGRSGVWQGTIENNRVCMTLASKSEGSSWMNGACFPVSEFSALPETESDFTLTRPAGTLTFRGKFEGKEGYGRFTFAADQSFLEWLNKEGISGMEDQMVIFLFFANTGKEYVEFLKKSGYNKISGEDLGRLAIHELDRKTIESFLEAARDLGDERPSIDDLLNLKIHDLDRDYIRAMAKTGFKGLNLENVLNAKIQDVTPEYVQQCRDMGFKGQTLDEVIGFKVHEITPEFMQQCRNMGFKEVNADDLMQLKIHEITPEFLQEMKLAGLSPGSVDEAVNLRIHEITGEYVRQLNAAGFSGLDIDAVINCRIHEVTDEYIRQLKSAGFSGLDVDQVINCRIHEVTAEFIQSMREKGFKDLELEEYIQLKIRHGNKM